MKTVTTIEQVAMTYEMATTEVRALVNAYNNGEQGTYDKSEEHDIMSDWDWEWFQLMDECKRFETDCEIEKYHMLKAITNLQEQRSWVTEAVIEWWDVENNRYQL